MGNCFASKAVDQSTLNHRSTAFSPPETSRGEINGGIVLIPSSSGGQNDDVTVNGEILVAPILKEYRFVELKKATRNFNSDMLLGTGGFGTVYKGWVDEKTLAPSKFGFGTAVAIKKINHESMQGLAEWQSEVNFLSRLSHPNLVKLLGYCYDQKEPLVVHEFAHRGSFQNHLFRRSSNTESLSWDVRLRIAIGAAQGLAYLHSLEKQVILRVFKASNILLDKNYNAKISDFGLLPGGRLEDCLGIVTRGYVDPMYVASGHFDVKSDVYGFGVVLLEMLTGLRAWDNKRPSGQRLLVDWLKPKISHISSGYLKSIMDARMEGQYSSHAALEALKLTLRCLESNDRRKRPSMRDVVGHLEQIQTIQ